MIILFYGQPASGKTTIADAFCKKMTNDYYYHFSTNKFIRIDGDRWRDVTKNKDYSKEGRLKNLKGAFDMAIYLANDRYVPVLSFVTPYEELRKHLRQNSDRLVEIYLEYSEDRGRNANFANDFEQPEINEKCLKINTTELSITECVEKVIDYVLNK
jgi:adenylylsulfate kinase-like enzyme